MPRLVKHAATGPFKIEQVEKLPIFICMCGLSKNKPYCDGSHKKTRDEDAAELYAYDEQGRIRVAKEY